MYSIVESCHELKQRASVLDVFSGLVPGKSIIYLVRINQTGRFPTYTNKSETLCTGSWGGLCYKTARNMK